MHFVGNNIDYEANDYWVLGIPLEMIEYTCLTFIFQIIEQSEV